MLLKLCDGKKILLGKKKRKGMFVPTLSAISFSCFPLSSVARIAALQCQNLNVLKYNLIIITFRIMIIIISYMLQQQTQREKGNPKAEQEL